jgi:hypothetical protein
MPAGTESDEQPFAPVHLCAFAVKAFSEQATYAISLELMRGGLTGRSFTIRRACHCAW